MPRRQTTRDAAHQTASQQTCPRNPRTYCSGVTTPPVSTSTGNDSTYGNHSTPATDATAGGRSASGAIRPQRKSEKPHRSLLNAVGDVVPQDRTAAAVVAHESLFTGPRPAAHA